MNELLREFFYDGIARMIPGLIAIAFYGRPILLQGDFEHAALPLTICIFLAAWAIGTAIELFSFLPIDILLRRKAKKSSKAKDVLNFLEPDYSTIPKTLTPPVNAETLSRRYTKAVAETTMFRCLSILFCLNLCLNPKAFWSITWNRYYDALTLAVFITVLLLIKYHIFWHIKQSESAANNQHSPSVTHIDQA
ncbi:MAG TPA: hypothetical protein VN784_10650 [Candidatus Limnocylindrales bacterium]|nr:hypothetical protein [Candidatus Limnocylindrales bacterium]